MTKVHSFKVQIQIVLHDLSPFLCSSPKGFAFVKDLLGIFSVSQYQTFPTHKINPHAYQGSPELVNFLKSSVHWNSSLAYFTFLFSHLLVLGIEIWQPENYTLEEPRSCETCCNDCLENHLKHTWIHSYHWRFPYVCFVKFSLLEILLKKKILYGRWVF